MGGVETQKTVKRGARSVPAGFEAKKEITHYEDSELVIILVVVLLIFGPKNLPKLGASLGKTVKSLREGMAFDKKDDEEVEEIIEIVEDEPEVAYATAGEPETKVVKKVVRKKAE